jgi:tRNA(Ile)-lysidine synthase
VSNNRFHPYVASVLDTVRERALLDADDRVLVALSAGPDSTALLAAMAALRDAGHLAAVAALHVDHGLRPGGREDAACAAAACARLGVAFESVTVEVAPGNVQAQARRVRYAALRAGAARAGATRIATGHTRSDQAETVLLRLLRGAGARGLGGIPPRRGAIVRPLIDRSRAEGIAFVQELGLAFREDPSNATPRFARNRVRSTIWPVIAAFAPAAEGALARAADLCRDDERALSARARRRLKARAAVPLDELRREPVAVRRRIVRRLWRLASGSGRVALPAARVEAVLALANRRRPGRVTLPGGLEGRCRYGTLEIVPIADPVAPVAPVPIPAPGRYPVPGRAVVVEVSARQADLVPWPLVLRSRRAGDRFRGAAGAKKLKSWLIDRKVPVEEREGLLVLAVQDEVVAIAGHAVAAGFGRSGAGLEVRITTAPEGAGSYCKGGEGLL